MNTLFKLIASKLPESLQQELKRLQFKRQINNNTFHTDEPEFMRLHEWVSKGDWVLDVGANVGHYSKRFSELVGVTGRVVAIEPMLSTFELLVSNIARFRFPNVTPLNVAASSEPGVVEMTMPKFETGLNNYYQAKIGGSGAGLVVVKCCLDRLLDEFRFALIKIDVEGHEYEALTGLMSVITRSRPVLIVEGFDEKVTALLKGVGYSACQFDGSPNRVFTYGASADA